MNEQREDRMFADWLREGPERGPGDGPARVFAWTRRTRQRPAWTFASRWTGSPWPEQGLLVPALFLVLLLVLAAAAVLMVGSTRHHGAPLTGPAGNGAIAWDTGTGGQVFLAAPDGHDPRPVQGAFAITRNPSFSRDGTKVVFVSRPDQDPDTPLAAFSANADGTDVRRIDGGIVIGLTLLSGASWSPDGRRVVVSAGQGDTSRLYVLAVDASAPPIPLTGIDASRTFPTWSPNGDWIAFFKLTPDGLASISLIRPDGSGQHDLLSQPDVPDRAIWRGPVWAPDSSAILYARSGSPANADESPDDAYVEVAPIDGTPPKRLYVEPGGGIGNPDWSPDGKWITFGIGALEGRPILVHPDGSGLTELAPGPPQGSEDCSVRFAPDAQSLVSDCAGFRRFYLSDLQHPVVLPVPSGAAAWDWQRAPLP